MVAATGKEMMLAGTAPFATGALVWIAANLVGRRPGR